MKLSLLFTTIPLLVATLSLQSIHAWTFGRLPMLYGNSLMSPMVMSPGTLLRQQQAMMDKVLTRSSPSFQISDDDNKFQISIDVPGVKMEDIQVQVEEDGQILTISAHRESVKDGATYTSQFSQSFSLDPSVDVEKFSAQLQNGVLVVAAPKDMKRIEEKIRRIPVMAGEAVTHSSAASLGEAVEAHHEEEKPAAETQHHQEAVAA